MAKKVVGREMTSRVGLDSAEAVKSLKQLTAEVKANTSGWKAQETALKSAGEYQKAAAARVNGLIKSMEAQKAKIDELKSRQAGLNRDTKTGEEQYLKLTDQINKASRSYDSMGGQLDRAKSKLQYYNSGLADLQKGYKQITAVSESYVKRLEAEGRSAEANKARLSGLKQAYSNMEAQYKAQVNELERIKTASGATSDAYKRQQVRVNETATSMAKLKSETNELDSAMNKAKPTAFTRMLDSAKSKLGLVREEEKKTKDETKHFAIGVAIGNTISNAASSAIGYIKGVTKQGYELAEAGATIKKQWNNLGLSDSEATKMIKQIGDIRSKANMSGGAIDQMQKKFFAITNSTSKARDMTEVLASYGSAAGKSGDQIVSLTQGIAKLTGSTKVTASLFKRTFSQVPELQKAIIKASGMSTDAFNKQLAAGKITGSQLQGYMVKAAKTSGKAWEEFGDTTKGKMAAIQGTYTNLKVAFAKPLVSGIEKAIDGISEKKGALDHVKKSLSDLVGVLGKKTGQYVGNVISFLVKNEKSIEKMGGAFASIVGSLAKGAWSAVAGALKLIGGRSKDASTGMNGVAAATAAIAKHKTAIENVGKAIMVYLAASKLKTIGSTIFGIAGGIGKVIGTMTRLVKSEKLATAAQWLFNAAMDANPIGIAVVALGALTAGLVLAYKHIKPFREWVNKTFKSVVNFGKGIAKWGSNVGKSIARSLGNMSKKWNGFKKSFGKSWNSHWSAMGKSLRNSWNGSVKNTRNFFSTVGNKWNGFKKSFGKSWNEHWSNNGKALKRSWNSSVKNTRNFFSTVGSKWNGFKNSFRKSWNSHWNDMRSNLHSAWNKSYKHTRDFFSSMGTKWAGWKKSWSHSWNNHWDTMRANLHNYWNKDLSHTRVFGHSMGDWLSAFKKSFGSGWSSLGRGVENIFKSLWSNLKRLARDGMNDVIDLINGGIDAVDSVIHMFGGKRKTIADLGHVHFATGTGVFSGSRNPITRPTMAMLNDGNDSPQTGNKEMVVLPNGDSGIVQGRNTKMLLPAGSEVLSASETAMLMSMQGVTKYAKGTGFFGDILNSVTSGISGVTSWVGKKVGSLEKFFKTATNIIAHPIKSLENLFSWSSKGVAGVMSNIGHGLFNGVEKQAKTWWSTLWSMVDLSGGGSYGGGWQSPGSGWTHTDSFGSPRGGGVHDGNDFSARVGTPFHAMHGGTVIRVGNPPAGWGAVGYNIVTRDSTGKEIIYQEFGNAKDVRVHTGQHVKTGDILGVLGHSGLGTGPHLHVGLTNGGSVWSRNGMSTAGWLDITKQHGKDKGSDADSDTNNSLQKTIKNQVGGGFWKFISKLAAMFGDSGTGDPGGAGVQRWRSDVKRALSELGLSTSASMVSRVLRQINTESGGNPKAMGGTDGLADGHAEGLMQVKPGTFSAYHLPGHNNIWNGYDNLLAGLNYAKHRYGSGLSFLGNGHGYENGGIINTNQLIEVAEHNKPEMVLPLTNKSRANQLISQASQIVNGNNGSQVVSTNSESNKKLDKLISLMSAILGNMGNVQAVIAKSDVVNAVKSDNKTASQYSQMMGY
ncbi:tape measure protein [Pediococcus acidilactici]|uniref:tape measure protein n=1 Tax=Pediococcus acidilactici TaxID=1254 RepID=UPI00140FE391|nr:tape measure protein [Pediococcus acidilactici]QIO85070.1 peptidoglycan DD-metalloendopeptidase family protein [Pediococcus acidilactici]QJW86562.1 peptidoglycan DD-metalloendopeptidase family protein [Pediococcus acidilactici]QYI95407.1 peptidoglycan DD-metalloendopeptidase family protein [Pediococcus acidilactici]